MSRRAGNLAPQPEPTAGTVGPSNASAATRHRPALALDGTPAKAEPKTLRYRILHAAAKLTRST